MDEKLFPTKACCKFMQYMPNKPDQFGLKFWPAVDLEFKYIPNAVSYPGKDEARPATQKLSESVVIQIVKPYLGKGRSVTTDIFFTSTRLATQLWKKKIVTCPDPKQNLKGCSASGKSFTTEQIIQQILVKKTDNNQATSLTAYQCKQKKKVCILSTLRNLLWPIKQKKQTGNTYILQ